MSRYYFPLVWFFVLVSFPVISGCGEPRPAGFPKIYPVSAVVMQEGKPLEGAAISFHDSTGSMTWSIGGLTDAQGKTVLTTHGKFVGAPEGKFKVVVRKQVTEGEKEYNDAMNREDPAAAAKIPVHVYAYVEDIYNSPLTTPVEVEITRSTKTIEIDAGPAVKIEKEFLR